MKFFGMRIAGTLAACLLGFAVLAQPSRLMAQDAAATPATPPAGGATIHGHVNNPAGQPLTSGEVRLSTDKNPSTAGAKFEYSFPIDSSGNYKGVVDKPANYIGAVFQQGKGVDYIPSPIAAGQDKQLDFDMSRKEYVDKMSPAEREQLEEFKKKNAEVTAANAKIENLNALLKSARAASKSGDYDTAVKNMSDATAAKPDEPILWDTLGDAQLGQATAAAKTAHDAKTTDPSVADKYASAITSYQKAVTLNAALAKPNPELAAVADNQLGQAFAKIGKTKEAGDAYESAAKADPTKAATYYYNEAATLFNANDMPDAAIAADKAIAADPTKVDAYYIKGQALIGNATVDPKTNKITAPPDCIAAYNKYLELAPTGPHAEEIKGILQGIGATVPENYKAPGKKR
jgi:tetratricopeptide (TPR) repeat protein